MPKKRVPSLDSADDVGRDPTFLAGWQATGPSLAVTAGSAVLGGLGTLLGAVVFAPVVHALGRLRAAAPGASNVADLVAAPLGRRVGTVTVILQTLGFLMLAVPATQTVGVEVSAPLVDDPTVLPDSWLWPLVSVTALAVLSLFVETASDRVVAGVTAVLAIVGLLIIFYVALAVIATILTTGRSGVAAPGGLIDGSPTVNGLATISTLASFAAGLVGFDVVTARSGEVRRLGRPMGIALGATALVAVLLWYADQLGSGGELRFDAHGFGFVVQQLYPGAGVAALAVAAILVSLALLVALLWGITRLVRRVPASRIVLVAAVVVIAVMVVARSHRWLGILGGVDVVGLILLLVVYAIVVEASARLGDSTFTWWSRFLTPTALAALVLLPVLNFRFAPATVVPLVVSAVLVGGAVLVAVAMDRMPPG